MKKLIAATSLFALVTASANELAGVDQNGNTCSIEITDKVEVIHDVNDSEETLNQRGLTGVETISVADVAFYKKTFFGKKEVFVEGYTVRSLYDTMWNAFELYRSEGHSGNMVLKLNYDQEGSLLSYTYGEFGDSPIVDCRL